MSLRTILFISVVFIVLLSCGDNSSDSANSRNNDPAFEDDFEILKNKNENIPIKTKEFYKYLVRGHKKKENGDYKGAIDDFNLAIKLKPKLSNLYDARGTAKYYKGDYDGAILDYNQSINLNSKNPLSYYNRGLAENCLQKYSESIKDFNKAIELKPNYFDAFKNRGLAKSDSGDINGSIADFSKLIEISPKYPGPYNNRGIAYSINKDYKSAIIDFSKAHKIDWKNPNILINRGLAYRSLKKQKEALEDFKQATVLGPDMASGFHYFSDTLINSTASKAKMVIALKNSLKANQLSYFKNIYYLETLSWAYEKNNHIKESIDILKKVISLTPDDQPNKKRFIKRLKHLNTIKN
ncbi:MAG: hypothetical protein COA79_06325 [Planctomycetota bacterium]|nr:MAG: hypothetical protein COA79_06325 [Planctomycetota bacterium]